MYATNYFETKILNTFLNVTAVSASNLFVALFLSNPTETGVAGNEVNYSGYTRQRVTFVEPYSESGGIGVKNDTDLLWNTAPNDVGQAKFIGLYDSATLGSGNMWLYGELSVPLDIRANQQPSIYEGDILYFATGNFSNAFKTKVLNLLRGQNLAGFSPHLALFNGDPENAGSELSGGAYARQQITFAAPSEQASGQMMVQNANLVKFPSPTTVWGNWAFDGLMDSAASGGLVLKTINPRPEIIQKNYVPSVNPGDYKVMVN